MKSRLHFIYIYGVGTLNMYFPLLHPINFSTNAIGGKVTKLKKRQMLQKDRTVSYLCDPALDPLDFLLDFFPPLLSDGGGGGLVAKNTFSALRSLCI